MTSEVNKVILEFKERFHKNTIYKVGDTYPKEGFEADEKRVEQLSSANNIYRKPFLEKEKKKSPKSSTTSAKK